jgi:hypothetical protein
MLIWHKELWLIDHGASLYFHHSWDNWEEQAKRAFAQVKDHVLLPQATELEQVDKNFRSLLTPELIRSIVSLIPADWLTSGGQTEPADKIREVYNQFLLVRIESSESFVKDAQNARKALI